MKKLLVYILILFQPIFCNTSGVFALSDEKNQENNDPAEALKKGHRFFTITIENDSFGGGTDKNYTSGVRLTYFSTAAIPPDYVKEVDRYIPFFEINPTTSLYFSIGHNLYTPEDIETRVPDPDDRPYAAYLYGSAGLTTLSGNHIDELEVSLGVVGPWAMGEEIQKNVHDLFDTKDPSGWSHQLENEPTINIILQRQWPEFVAFKIAPLYFRLTPHAGACLGNVYTYAAGGMSVQFTPYETRWQSKPIRVRPAIPGNGFFDVPEYNFSWSVFAGVEGRAIARNIFLDGNTFEDSPSVDKKYFVADANVGASLTFGTVQLSYVLNWRSKEFDGQEDPSVFGVISLGVRF